MYFNFTKGSLIRGIGMWASLFCSLSLFGSEYYVDPLGDDAHDGSTPAKAWRTLAHAMSQATTSGDIVHAAPGVYNEGAMYVDGISNRVAISQGVGLVADYGRTVTSIVGAPDPETGSCGPKATRGVYLNKNAWIRGFKISGGYTSKLSSGNSRNGGGVFASDTTGVAVECELTGNYGYFRGFAAYQVALLRCYVHDNKSGADGASGYVAESALVCDSVILAPAGSEMYLTRNVDKIINCTINGYVGLATGSCEVYNSYIKNFHTNYTWKIKNCVTGTSELRLTTDKITKSNCTYNVPTNNLFDSSWRPKANEILVNQGDINLYQNNYPSSWMEKFGIPLDYAQSNRIVDAAIDIGAGEYQGEPIPPPTPSKPGTIFTVHGRRIEPGVTNYILAERCTPSQWPVVIPQNYAPSEYQAAADLREGVKLTTDCILPFECGTNPTQGIFIKIVDDAQLGEDGFRLKMEGRRLRITGGKRGVLYGVYELLERYAGCGWYAAWFSDYPACDSITIPADLDEVQVPAFDMRGTSAYYKDAVFSAHQRLNGLYQTFDAAHGGNTPYRFASGMGSCHTFLNIVKPEDYKDEHPEYFSYRTSRSGRLTSSGTQLCLTNPDVLNIASQKVVQAAIDNPAIKFFGVSQADNTNFCQCASCLNSYNTFGQSGTILNFVNPIADGVKKVRPDAWVETLAYQYSRRPPLNGVVPRDNVMICFCSIESEFGRPFRDSDSATGGYQNNIYFKEDLATWNQIAKRIFVWDYAINFHHYPFPFLDFGVIQPNLQFFYENGAKQIYEQGGGGGTANWYGDLRIYLFSKLLWNPYVNLEPYKDKFFNTYYGSAAALIREDFDAFSALPVGGTDKPIKIYADPETTLLSDQDFADSTERWLQATDLVKNDRPEVQRAVKIGLFCIDYSSTIRYAEQMGEVLPLVFTADSEAPKYQRLLRINEAARRAQAAMAADSTLKLSEGDERNETNKNLIDLFANYEVPTTNQDVLIVPADGLKNYRESNKATKVSQPGMTGTFVWEFDGSHHVWMFRVESNRFFDKPNSTYNVYVRLRVEGLAEDDPTDSDGQATGLNIWNAKFDNDNGDARTKVTVRKFKEADKDENGFAWFQIFSNWTPNSGEYIVMGPGYFSGIPRNTAFTKLQLDAVKVERISD